MNVPILAEKHLSRVVEIKQLIEDLQTEQKEIYSELNKFYSDGHLDYLKSSSGSITYKNTQFIHVKGRVTYDYSTDPDIKQKQLELRQLKKCAEAIGILESKQSPDTWRLKEVEINDN